MLTSKSTIFVSRHDGAESSEPSSRNLVIPTHNLVLASLPQAASNQIISASRAVHLKAGDVIYEAGNDINHIYFPVNAIVSALALLEDGSTVEISMTGKEGVVGLAALIGGGRALHWTRVSVGGDLLVIPTSVLLDLFEHSHPISQRILRAYRSLFTQICQRSVCNVRHTLLQRLCVWLLMTNDRLGTEQLPFTQEEIASRISVRRAGVSVAASMLQAMHAISYHRGRIVIKDRHAIESNACECYAILGQEFAGDSPRLTEFEPARSSKLPRTAEEAQ